LNRPKPVGIKQNLPLCWNQISTKNMVVEAIRRLRALICPGRWLKGAKRLIFAAVVEQFAQIDRN